MKKKSAAYRRSRSLLTALCILLALLLVILVGGAVYLEYMLNRIGRAEEQPQETLSQAEIDAIENPAGVDGDPDSEDVQLNNTHDVFIGGKDIVNILLIGQDRRAGEGRARSDAMILCTFNTKTGGVTMTSFMRDLYVEIPGYQDNRINAAYQLGGRELLNQTLLHNFGVEVDGNVEVDFFQFQQIIDYLGGVDLYLTAKEVDYLNRNGNWDVNGGTAGTWSLTEGVNHLTGEQALAYSRIRYVGNGDYGRTERQKAVLKALVDVYKSSSLTTMLKLVDDILPMLTTDMSNGDMLRYATTLFPMVKDAEISTLRIPADGAFYEANIRGMDVLVPDMEASRQILVEKLLGE